MTKKQITHWLSVIVIGVALGFGLQFVRAWTEPTEAPPGGNVGAPINTGAATQTKSGDVCTTAGGSTKCLGTGVDWSQSNVSSIDANKCAVVYAVGESWNMTTEKYKICMLYYTYEVNGSCTVGKMPDGTWGVRAQAAYIFDTPTNHAGCCMLCYN